jgi:hypothetical protein
VLTLTAIFGLAFVFSPRRGLFTRPGADATG